MGWAILQPIAGIVLAPYLPEFDQPGWVLDCISPTSSGAECVTEATCGPLLAHMGFDLSTAFLTAPGGAVFWSTDTTGKNPNQNMISAQAWATSNGKKTLEQTDGGVQLEKLNLFSDDPPFPKTVTSPINGITVPIASKATSAFYWNCASLYFAQGVAGTTHAFAEQVRVESPYGNRIPTFFGIELPAMLVKNPNQLIVFHYSDKVSVAFDGARYYNCANLDPLGTSGQKTLNSYNTENKKPYPLYGGGDNFIHKTDCLKSIQNFYPTPINNAQSIAYDIASKGLSWVVHNRRPPPSH